MTALEANKIIGENIAKARMSAGHTQMSLAFALHVCENTINKWETGKNAVKAPALCRSAKVLDTPVEKLLDDWEQEVDA